ncbi:hypothetical protein G647_06066 [Cladophialophora carrionii CBS 160.54]|uniref:Zn(2)-C6 fungal-type domain-containing protein n=1 Tax=Cladophialophora carrionii CBS 160.54 TaxID=1279043 RepID=V9D5R9_9EURO|nr:uncharacterized protein G647_06066 [Cladophialophora carrionii CBS 160.54]ETI21996.1 hypothetical protein G647_06066 [Cladophialophora carrionii CBS 160.54]
MVYNGKPSKACVHCRRRKLRCDLRKEACGQCVRAGLTCTGYRDPGQLRIQDESESTRQRALGLKSRSITSPIHVPLEEMARAAFFSHYVHGFSTTYDVLELISRQSGLDKHLAASVDAVSLAFFTFQYDAGSALKPAREKYLSALPLVKAALGAPEFLASNSTLLAVLLLDLFEKITNRSPISSESWMSHVRGALVLARLRDPAQLNTYIGLRLSVRLFTNMLISCVAANAPIPPALIKLRTELQAHMHRDDPKWRVSGLVMKYANFRGALQGGLLSHAEILKRAKKLDGEFSSLARDLPPCWISQRVALRKPSSAVLEQYYDVYPDYFTAQTCNVIRMMRILLNDLIRHTYLKTVAASGYPDPQGLNVGFASHIIDSMAKEICAAGPQFSGITEAHNGPSDASPSRRMHCYTLLFPFYVAALSASPKTGVRDWVIRRLRAMATDLGIKNAVSVAEMLERREGTSHWSVYAILGSYAFAA